MNKDQNFKSITRIGFVVNDIEQSAKSWAELLEMDVPEIMLSAPLDEAHTIYKEKSTDAQAKLAIFQLENITIELIEPIGDDSTWKEALDEKGEGIHHICYEVDDIVAEVASAKAKGLEVLGEIRPGAEGKTAFLHPRDTHGVLVEFVQKED